MRPEGGKCKWIKELKGSPACKMSSLKNYFLGGHAVQVGHVDVKQN